MAADPGHRPSASPRARDVLRFRRNDRRLRRPGRGWYGSGRYLGTRTALLTAADPKVERRAAGTPSHLRRLRRELTNGRFGRLATETVEPLAIVHSSTRN